MQLILSIYFRAKLCGDTTTETANVVSAVLNINLSLIEGKKMNTMYYNTVVQLPVVAIAPLKTEELKWHVCWAIGKAREQ